VGWGRERKGNNVEGDPVAGGARRGSDGWNRQRRWLVDPRWKKGGVGQGGESFYRVGRRDEVSGAQRPAAECTFNGGRWWVRNKVIGKAETPEENRGSQPIEWRRVAMVESAGDRSCDSLDKTTRLDGSEIGQRPGGPVWKETVKLGQVWK
jgi:hypothetical protein